MNVTPSLAMIGERATTIACKPSASSSAVDKASQRAPAKWPLVGILVVEHPDWCQQQDLHVQRKRPVANVVQIAVEPLADRRVPTQTVQLGPSGQARPHAVTLTVGGHFLGESLDKVGTLGARSDQAHFAPHDVDQLRQLVDAVTPEKDAEAGAARV